MRWLFKDLILIPGLLIMAALVILGYVAVIFDLQDLEEFAKKYGYDIRDIVTVLLSVVFFVVVARLLYRLHRLDSRRPTFEVGPLNGLSQDIDLVVQNMTGPVAEVSVNYRAIREISSGDVSQQNLQNRTLPPRDLDSDRIPIMQGQPGIFRLCRLNTDEDVIEFAVKTPGGMDWVSGGKNNLYRVEIDVNSNPPPQVEDEYLFRLTLQSPSPYLWLEYVNREVPRRKLRIPDRFRIKLPRNLRGSD